MICRTFTPAQRPALTKWYDNWERGRKTDYTGFIVKDTGQTPSPRDLYFMNDVTGLYETTLGPNPTLKSLVSRLDRGEDVCLELRSGTLDKRCGYTPDIFIPAPLERLIRARIFCLKDHGQKKVGHPSVIADLLRRGLRSAMDDPDWKDVFDLAREYGPVDVEP